MFNSSNNKRIAKNAGMLYIRMLITMAVSLYTSRIVLNTLGINDFGIYNVVGGFVSMFAFLSSSMAAATQRFLTFELGRKDFKQLSRVFSMSVNIHFVLSFVILILAETIGLWFINEQLTIPEERMIAANWVYQFSILAFLVNVVSVPYNAIIIAHERMNVYAWISIIEVILKLLIVFMLFWFEFEKLKLYAILVVTVSLIIRIIFIIYCRMNFPESIYKFFWDKSLFKTLLSYAGWNLWGNTASALCGQGINVVLNIFFGPAVNAARGIAYSINSAVGSFVHNFQLALNPQIVKSYASNDLKYMHQLIFQGSKYSFFLLFALSLPILLETEIILKLWLKIVPDFTIIFTQLVIINILIDTVSGPLLTATQASGNIKLYQGVIGSLLLLILPVSYVFLKLGFQPQVTFYISIITSIIALIARLKMVSPLVNMSILEFIKNVILRIIPVTILATVLSLIMQSFLIQSNIRLIFVGLISLISVAFSIYIVGLSGEEQKFMQRKVKQLITTIANKNG